MPWLVLLLAAGALAEGDAEPSRMLVLSDRNFTAVTEREELMLIDFYWDGCVHCKTMMPRLEEVARVLSLDDPPIPVATVNAEGNKECLRIAKVSEYPTMKISRGGELEDWESDGSSLLDHTWEVEGMVQKMRAARGQSSREVESPAGLQQFARKGLTEVLVFGIFPRGAGHDDYSVFQRVAHRFRGAVQFRHAVSREVVEAAGHMGRQSAVMMYRPFARKDFRLMYRGALSPKALSDWVLLNRVPPVGQLADGRGYAPYAARGVPVLRAFAAPGVPGEAERLAQLLEGECTARRKALACAVSPGEPPLVPAEGSQRPEDWNDAEDGEWQPDMVENARFGEVRCGMYHAGEYGFTPEDMLAGRAIVIEEAQRRRPAAFVYSPEHSLGDWLGLWAARKLPRWTPPSSGGGGSGGGGGEL
eukprot:TRINITY_DN35307_c0_g1_i1.p1 TRINITY_DN35307_c0_g1~~TRINITY_DN35307_c0_g1_i1.p1  ORF type:complete len:418 (+),score=149.44 TRINITY_DN35307_c0_g1_i1:75-1328(+)